MGVLKGDARLACVDLSNYAERKDEITKQLMEAATTVGYKLRTVLLVSSDADFRNAVQLAVSRTVQA